MELFFINFSGIFLIEQKFGFNPDILGSNVINIAILIGGIFYLGKKFILATLSERQQKVIEAIQEAEEKLTQAQSRLSEAQRQLSQTDLIITNIKQESEETAKNVKESVLNQGKVEIARLTSNSKLTVSNIEAQISQEVQDRIISLVLKRVLSLLNDQLNSEIQTRIIDYYIVNLGGKL
uniref:ATP synthase CF0 B chain n=1 Tax=Gronococcus sybilensis TaxID=3028029 RepID=A0A9Y1I2L1_9RHOD|nr:ATP synthase CF0 B chain [Gronococcus sybilensis]